MSIRRACRVLQSDPKMYRYKSRRGDQAALKERIKMIAETRVHYGYRRIHVLLRREGWFINEKRVHRLYPRDEPPITAQIAEAAREGEASG